MRKKKDHVLPMRKLREHEVSRETIQSAVRIASVIHAVAGVLEYQATAAA